MSDARVIVCEKTGRWAIALRRALRDLHVPVTETRSLAECRRELDRSPTSLVALELVPDKVEAILQQMLDLHARYRRTRVIMLAERGLEHYEWVFREAGAVHVLFSPRSLAATTRLVQRYMNSVPPAVIDIREAVRRRLPFAVTVGQSERQPRQHNREGRIDGE